MTLHTAARILPLLAVLLLTGCETTAQIAAEKADPEALELAVQDLSAAFPETYPDGQKFLERIRRCRERSAAGDAAAEAELSSVAREALLANPLLKGLDKVLVVRRDAGDPALGLPQNWQGNCSLPLRNYRNDIAVFAPGAPDAPLFPLYKPAEKHFVGDVDLHYDGDRLLFSMPGTHGRSQIWEIRTDGSGLRQVTPGDEPDVDNYDACYLPDGRIVYASTACYQGVPCVAGSDSVANLCIMNADGSGVRQLCFDQDHDWSPAVLNNGRVLYTRWEYADLPHSNSRMLFHMNPDGTDQVEYYGSNSYWPTSVMYARPLPGHPTAVCAIVSGHHGVPRMGELVLLDPARGRREADGAVQRIPGRGRTVEPIIADNLVDNSWPKFLHPYPLSDKYFLVSCQPAPGALWGVYLVDVFDNMTLLREEPGQALLEPLPLRSAPRPPVIPDRVKPGEKDAVVYVADIYAGPGLAGVPRGTVKSLRVLSYAFCYRKTGGLLGVVGMDGPWDVKRILGTVPVEEDGSAQFTVPANTPVAVQPLDEKGRAVQIMRSWFTAMPGERLSCVGCHEQKDETPPSKSTLASRRPPRPVAPWRGPVRGFSFAREVQPVLDRHCVECHDGTEKDRPDLRGTVQIQDWKSAYPGQGPANWAGKFSVAYASLHRYVRRPGIESDLRLLKPMEFHAGTTELVQMIENGHHGVTLDPESWDRLTTWIDLNTPYHGEWGAATGPEAVAEAAARRRELAKKYASLDVDYEAVFPTEIALPPRGDSPKPASPPETVSAVVVADDPEAGTVRTVDLGGGVTMDFVRVPAGRIERTASPDGPVETRTVDASFWMGRCEVTNAQYARFDPAHDSGIESMHAYQFGIHGYPLNGPEQPVVRVSCGQAEAFCRWLSERAGAAAALPTEAQWEHACRAGADTPFSFGGPDADFSGHANLGDIRLREYARNNYIQVNLLENAGPYDDWVPRDTRFDDGMFVAAPVGRYAANAFGLHDLHGNVWEWTSSPFAPDGGGDTRAVRGGSWYDRPHRAEASSRIGYAPWQGVFNVGFRVVLADAGTGSK
ncbi:MAG TPA: SUMF1/EgtB/PvdO family nonheme iron enzyme [Candidatus Hydrogenedentes bacterium]|nr:SUMF1/EgtB/PvdO family nonheme iron enzyme [Candidatus Hydrogenedentota bacterium]